MTMVIVGVARLRNSGFTPDFGEGVPGPGARDRRTHVILAGGCKDRAAQAGACTAASLRTQTAFGTIPAQESRTVHLTA